MMFQRTYPFLFAVLLSWSIVAQNHTYDIISKKDTLGILQVSKLMQGEHLVYYYHVDMKVKLLMNVHMKYTIKATYDNSRLLSANVDNIINEKSHHSSQMKWQNSSYILTIKNKKPQKLEEEITYSGIRLFFDEPLGVDKVFSEYTTKNGQLTKIDNGIYELTLHNGKKNRYFYKNEELVKATIYNSLIKFDLILRE